MIGIFRARQTANCKACKYCGKKDYITKETIIIDPLVVNQEKWNFHNECFSKFRKQISEVNIFRVKEK